MYIVNYECLSSAGLGVEKFMQGLQNGEDHSVPLTETTFSHPVWPTGRACFIPDQDLKNRQYSETFKKHFSLVWEKLAEKFEVDLDLKGSLFILASTKGLLEEYIWQGSSQATGQDPFSLAAQEIRESLANDQIEILTVSNACSSSHVAFELADKILKTKRYKNIFVVAFDYVGPFVVRGFQSLKVFAKEKNRPFSAIRDGLQLGEAVAIFHLSADADSNSRAKLVGAASTLQTQSVTRPSMDGSTLMQVLESLLSENPSEDQHSFLKPDFFIAHGTGTTFNDLSEDRALAEFQKNRNFSAPVTSTKWSIGHCLGASGAMDIIAACELLNGAHFFSIANTEQIDSQLQNHYIFAKSKMNEVIFDQKSPRAIVTSLGFGGVHAAVHLKAGL